MLEEKSKVESCEHQDDANVHCQPFPQMVSEEQNIYTDYDGYHRHHVKHYSYLSAHFRNRTLPMPLSIISTAPKRTLTAAELGQ